ncbi:molybdopterin molybdotransferase MoeA [Paracidovorax valerianellae]|uniref:Molybdopterin molybdenumtransferase n=1 Tax=Paracidovorax valerianellae TaxID=187868 RepID=A0A1G6IPC0_9BURK|nr:molybdopterin molybdotransferase MoeA [Paracidovorax valerianellae]MDA8447853.1 molybdopterin molybdotransferase MoeA [Paracidovorax valerianellae]SDC08293.1 molybdopterin molybdotransferase [Paracidovorax valerianellae]
MTTKTLSEIAASVTGYQPKALPAEAVTAFLQQLVQPLAETESVSLFAALDRVLATDLVSPISVPPHDNSAMDGYAFDGSQLLQVAPGEPLTLRVVGTALAGQTRPASAGPGECVRIMTGAVMPPRLDTVVPQELASVDGDTVHIGAGLLRPGDHRRRAGEDLMQGRVALARGERLTPAALGLVASLGLPSVNVFRWLRVACFSTGDELLSPGDAPRAGAVYDSNRYALLGLLARLGVEPIDLGVVPDTPAQLEAALRRAARQADAVITSGGVSEGDADHLRSTVQRLGDVAFWHVAMRPGRPMAVGRLRREGPDGPMIESASSAINTKADSYHNNSNESTASSLWFGLPGNPVAAMVAFLAFVRPALLRAMGCTRPAAPMLRATTTEALNKKPGRTEYQRGIVSAAPDGALQVRTTGHQGSGVLSSMVQSNGLIVLPHGRGPVNAGDTVDVMMFDGAL